MKEANLKGQHTVRFQPYDILEKVKLMETVKRSVVVRTQGEGRDESVKHRGFLGQRNYSSGYIHVIIYLSKSIDGTSKVNPKVNYKFGVIMMCQCGIINYNKYTTAVAGCLQQRLYTCGDKGVYGKILYLSVLLWT